MLRADDYINSYIRWLKENIHTKEVNGFFEITTPFLDRRNDHLQIYAKQIGDKIILTDDGYIINDLVMCGCDISSPRRQKVLFTILNGLGVKIDDNTLTIEATIDNYPQKKHALIQAMISVNDMFMMSRHSVASLFLEDVEIFLEQYEVRYTPSIQLVGKSGFAHNFDFVIPASKQKPERLIKAINTPTKDKVQTVLFAWSDTRETRRNESVMFVFLNDLENKVRPDIELALSEYNITPIPWSARQSYISELTA